MSDKKDLPTTPESDAILARAHIRSGDLPRFTVIEPEPETPGSVEEAAEHLAAAVLAEAHNYRIDKAILTVALTRALPDILAARLAAVQAELAHEKVHNAYLETELDADAKHAALAEGETCDVCTHLESEQIQQWMAMDLDWQSRAESAAAARDTALREKADLEARLAAVEALVAPAWRANRGHEYDTTTKAFAAGRNDHIDRIRAALANPPAEEES